MSQYEYGDRIGKTGKLKVGCSAIILDDTGEKILLTRRTDNGRWCLPGGAMEEGESAEEACVREVWEETGLHARVTKLLGIYTTPNRVTFYNDGNRWQLVAMSFLAETTGGTLGLSNETTEAGYFGLSEITQLDLMEPHQERIKDYLVKQEAAFIK